MVPSMEDGCILDDRDELALTSAPSPSMPGGVVVAQRTLDPLTEVRILAGQLLFYKFHGANKRTLWNADALNQRNLFQLSVEVG